MIIQQLLGPNGLIASVKDTVQCCVSILWGGRIFYTYDPKNIFAKNLGIAMLAKLGVLKKTLSEIFEVERHTVGRIYKIYQEEGVEGLKDYKKGPKQTNDDLKAFIIQKYKELGNKWGYQQKIIRTYKKKTKTQQERENEKKEQSEKKRELNEEKKKAEEKSCEEVKRLQAELFTGEEQCVQHGGAAAVIPLLSGFGVKNYLPRETEEGKLFNISEMVVSYTALNAASLVEVEQDFKLLARYQMGGIIGRVKLPSLTLYRTRIPKIVEQMDMIQVMVETAKEVHAIFGFSKVVYIDGHFMPYFGKSAILYGYNSQRRLAMHGREYFFVHDANGLPVYAAISDGYRKMKHYIEEVDAKLQEIYGVGEKELLEIFDRGGYSKAFCVNI